MHKLLIVLSEHSTGNQLDSQMSGNEEEGIDLGGPQREYLTLLIQELELSPMLAGPEGDKNLSLDSTGKSLH